MFGDYIARGSAGAVFSSPSDPNQVIKIFNLDARDPLLSHMNRLQFQFFEDLEAQQKQDIKTPGLPQINYTFTGEVTPQIMTQISESIKPSQQFDYAAIKSNFRYGDKYAIILMDRVSKIGPQDSEEPLGRRGLTPMLRHAYQMGYYVRDLWPENKGMSSDGDIIWFDPMVAPVNPVTDQDREALKILFEWNEYTQRQYQEAVRDKSYFDYEHKAGLFYSEDDTPITNVTYKDIAKPEWLAAAAKQANEDSEFGVLDEDGNRYAQVMLGPDYGDKIKEIIVNNPNGFMMTWADIESFGLEMDLDHTFWVYPINHKHVGGPDDASWDAVVMDGHWVMSGGKKGTYDSFPLNDLFDATTGENPLYHLHRFTKVISRSLKKYAAINYTTLDKSFSADLKNFNFDSENDNYWLRGGCGKAAAMISKDLDRKNTSYHYEIGLAYIEGAFMGNHIVVVSEAGDQDHYGTGGAKKRWENMMLSELVDQELPASMVEDIITFEWHKVDPQEDWSVVIAGEYLPVSGPMITKDTLSMSAESYPTCYLCPKPAKIEVMTAIGMRNFCGNKCRGDYEGIDYGPDDYYISPKLEHDIELVSYYPGSISSPNRSATLSAKCRNCDFTTRNQSFYQHHLVKTLEEWDEDAEEWWDTGEKCRHDKMQYLDYLENGEDAWGNIIAGHIVIGCPTCGFKDTLSHVNIPQGCDNRGRVEDYIRF